MVWSGEHRAFVLEEFIKDGGSVSKPSEPFALTLLSVGVIPFPLDQQLEIGHQILERHLLH
jgi:hypothetical protein